MTDLQCSPSSPRVAADQTLRSSSRLREKSQRRFTLPTRREALDSVVPDETPFKNYRDYKPRKLINNFIKERNTYNNPDRIDQFDEFSDEEFINDNTSSSDDSTQEGSPWSESPSHSSSDDDDDEPVQATARNPRKAKSKRKTSSGRNGSDSEELASPLKMRKPRPLAELLSGSDDPDNSSGDDLPLTAPRKKWRGRASIQCEESSDDDKDQPGAFTLDLSGSVSVKVESGDNERNGTEVETSAIKAELQDEHKGGNLAIKADPEDREYDIEGENVAFKVEPLDEANKFRGDANTADESHESSDGTESEDDSFIATSSSSDDGALDPEGNISPLENFQADQPSHEELICNYRQRRLRPKKALAVKKKRSFRKSLDSDSSSCQSDGSTSWDKDKSGEHSKDCAMRPLSKRAEHLQRKKAVWKTEVLGSYKNEREKKLSKTKK
ncbi:protein IWS1 homolog A-like [Acanthaster planci]|uniref:Protein IWS1 homolog A-like n=1 Tax=Acanthaster planci TaxID=133434 RepID=A0A8B7ZQ51_ACAPL|nr:protein IWS1 homolog A-like [Acanthaster planci]